jgi:hypothetical protein
MCVGNWLSVLLNTNMNLRLGFEELAASVLQLVEISKIVLLPPAEAQLVEALHYKPEGRGSDSHWCQWNFSLNQPLREMSTWNISWELKAGSA